MANAVNLSKLSRGQVKVSQNGSRLEVYADHSERPLMRTSVINQSSALPKTYSTKRGPLILFADTDLLKHSRAKVYRSKKSIQHDTNSPSLISPPPLKYGELKRSILAYGGTPDKQFADGVVDEDGTFIYMKIPSKKRSHPSKYAGITPSVAIKRRYMIASTDDKKRDVDFIGIVDAEYSASRNQRHSMMKTHVLSDEISLIPPIYRNPDVVQHSPIILSNAYRFFKIESTFPLNENESNQEHQQEHSNALEVIDSKGSHIIYENLEQHEKEKVLADLLIQTALENIANQQNIEVFEDALNRVRDVEINNSFLSADAPLPIEETSLPMLQSEAASEHQQTTQSMEILNDAAIQQQNYMFGKMQGSRWIRNRPTYSNLSPTKSKMQTHNSERNSETTATDDFTNEYTQTTSDFVHMKVMRASRLLGPISNSAHPESLTVRSQQYHSSKMPLKSRKFHENDLTSSKISIKRTNQQVLTWNRNEQNTNNKKESSDENESSFVNPIRNQHSSKSIRRNPSRLGTGHTFATGRCVTSPLSIKEAAERILNMESENDDESNDENKNDTDGKESPIPNAAEHVLIRNITHSPATKTDDEHDHHLHPSAMNTTENNLEPTDGYAQRSAYTNRSQGTFKTKVSSTAPLGALLIAPDGEILTVGGLPGPLDNEFDKSMGVRDVFAHQPSTATLVVNSNDPQLPVVAPCVPVVLGTKRERLPDETVVRRTLNLSGGDFNSQVALQSWSYDKPTEQRRPPPQPYTFIPAPPPMGLSAFTGRKHHHQKRIAQEVHDHATLHTTFSMHSETVQPPSHSINQSNVKSRGVNEAHSPMFAFTKWAYQRPPTPPMVKQPYLYKPDYRPNGAHGVKHHAGDSETLIRRTIDVHAGDIDASLSFTIWVYDMWINDLVKSGADPSYVKQVKGLFDLFKQRRLSKVDLQDRDFLTALASHAQTLARIILNRSDSGYHLAEDAQRAILESLRGLKYLLDEKLATVSDEVYREILRDTLQVVLTKGNLQHLQVTDEILAALMDYPIEAFEIYYDPQTGEERIRIKNDYRPRRHKMKMKKPKKKTKTVIISEEISPDDFERIIDPQTGQYVYQFKRDVAAQKGFLDLMDMYFDIIKDRRTGERFVQIRTLPYDINLKVEIFVDSDSGKQILVLKKEVPIAPPVVQSDIGIEDFELVTDERTGEQVFRLRADAAAQKGLTSLGQTNFEVVVDENTGQTVIRMKNDGSNQLGAGRIEIFTDATTGKQTIRMVADDPTDDDQSDEQVVTVTENDIEMNDFERVIDPTTGREILRMKADVLKSKGLEELAYAEFEIVIDAVTGQSKIVLKTPTADLADGTNTHFEIVVDIVTGKQKLIKRTITEKEDDRMDVTESQLNVDDFERVVDSNTGLEVLRLKKGAAARKGLGDLLDVQFELVTDADGKQTIAIKGGATQGNTGDVKFELVTDDSGRVTVKVRKERPPTPEAEVVEKSIDVNDFEEVIDSKTGLTVLKLKPEVAKRAGMTELLDAQFETYIDPNTGKQAVRVKPNSGDESNDVKFEIITDESGKQVLRMIQEIPKTIEVTNSDINTNDFEEVIDNKTGKTVLRMKKEVAKRKGLVDMDNVDFEYVVDEKTGQQVIQIKGGNDKITKGNVTYEMLIDPLTGQQTIRMKQEVEVKFETIENDLAKSDFEEIIDGITGERILKLTTEAAIRKGLTDLQDVAFEVYVDPTTGTEQIRIKGGNQTGKLDGDQKFEMYVDKKTGQQKIILRRPKDRTPPPVEKSIDSNDFEKVTDPNTGKEFYRLTEEAARRKGLTNVKDMEFDLEVDATTGKTVMKPKVNAINGQKVEVITDPKTGEQTIRIVKQPIKELATITTTIDLDENAFTTYIDPETGKPVMNLSKELMENYGLDKVEFEEVTDEKTGEKTIRMKPMVAKDGKVYELITDPLTGKQSLQIKEKVTQEQLTTITEQREAKGLRIPKTINPHVTTTDSTGGQGKTSHTDGNALTVRKDASFLSPDNGVTRSPTDNSLTGNRHANQTPSRNRQVKTKTPSKAEDEVEWTLDDEKQLNGLSVYEQRKRKEQILAEKKRQVAEVKRQEDLAHQLRLKRQQENLLNNTNNQSMTLLNTEEQERERDLRKLDAERDVLTDEEYQARRKKLFLERSRVLKDAYDRKLNNIQRAAGTTGNGTLDPSQAAQLEQELEKQIRAEEDLILSMMSPEEREDYIRARNEERARQRLLAERERAKREEELQAALAETKRMAAIRAAEITAQELQKRSANSMYAELRDLVTEQKISRAFTYSYFSLLQFLSSSNNSVH